MPLRGVVRDEYGALPARRPLGQSGDSASARLAGAREHRHRSSSRGRPIGRRARPCLAHPDDYNGFAEFIRSKPAGLARLPDDLPDLAAMVVAQPLATVLRAMARTGPVINQRCAVVGQGPMGLIFTHLLGRMGASQVIGIDRVAWRLPWARRFGATDGDRRLAGRRRRGRARTLTGGKMVDFCVEAVGHPDALDMAARLPRRQGRLYVFGVPHHESQPFPWFHHRGQ